MWCKITDYSKTLHESSTKLKLSNTVVSYETSQHYHRDERHQLRVLSTSIRDAPSVEIFIYVTITAWYFENQHIRRMLLCSHSSARTRIFVMITGNSSRRAHPTDLLKYCMRWRCKTSATCTSDGAPTRCGMCAFIFRESPILKGRRTIIFARQFACS